MSKNLKNTDLSKFGQAKIPDRIEDMTPLPSPNKKIINSAKNKEAPNNQSVSPDFRS